MKKKTRQTLLALALIVGGCALFVLSASLHQKMNVPPAQTAAPKREASALPPVTPEPSPTPSPEPTPEPAPLIVIDPGHQAQGDPAPEPIGPGAEKMKARVTDGTQGVVTGIPEYELNLTVSQLLRDELISRGYRAVLTRDTNEVSLSNTERAALANELRADAFIRIHANADEDASVRGVMSICITPQNPYVGSLYPSCRSLADTLLQSLGEAVGCEAERRTLWETDSMSGLNHSLVPACIVEMGYMSNPEEDLLLADDAYRHQIVLGLADGLDAWLASQRESTTQGRP